MGNLKCEISEKRLIVERNVRKFGTLGTTVHIRRVLMMPEYLEFGLGHSVHFAKFPIARFSKLLLQQFSSDFNQTSYKVS